MLKNIGAASGTLSRIPWRRSWSKDPRIMLFHRRMGSLRSILAVSKRSGAKALLFGQAIVAAEAATHKPAHHFECNFLPTKVDGIGGVAWIGMFGVSRGADCRAGQRARSGC